MVLALQPSPAPAIGSTWISANAGSGKTRALVERVVTLLLLGVTPERICCITYTKAAAGEMRERILKALRELLVLDDDACRARVHALTGHSDIALARSLFARVLDSPFGGLQLTTIHGFCQQLLRRFPLESGLSPQFTVLEDAETENLTRLARQRVLEHAESNHELGAALGLIATRSGESAFKELVAGAISQSAWWEQVQEAYPLPVLLKEAIYAHHGLTPDTTEDAVRRAACATLIPTDMAVALRAALPAFEQKKDAPFLPIFARWLEGGSTDERLVLLDALEPLLLTKEGELRNPPFSKQVPMAEALQRFAASYLSMHEQCRAVACAEESYAAALVSQAFLTQYQRLKTEAQALDYNDLIRSTEHLLREHSGWVMSKLDHRIDHLLVDEAQDTSPGQWRIVRTLVEELVVTGGGVGSGQVPRSLLVVGDEKQSIFSFQGADPKQFAREAAGFMQLLEASGGGLERRALENSYRSTQAVLTLVDAVAALPPVARALSGDGTPSRHYMKRADQPVGRVVLHAPLPEVKKGKPEPFTLPLHYAMAESAPQRLANHMADDIAGWLAEGRCVPGDILILLWRRQPFADCLIHALETRQIPVAGIDRLKLSGHLAVRDLMALMQWCGYPRDDLSLAHVLRSPIIGMDEMQLETLAHGRTADLWQQVQAQVPGVAAQLEAMLRQRYRTPYDFLTYTLEVQCARARFAARFGEEVHEVLDELKAQATQLPKSLPATIEAFADWMMRSEREVKRQQEGQGHAVRIMTVHGSKGLEAPIVLVVNPAKNPDTSRERSLKGEGHVPLLAFSEAGKAAAAYRKGKDAVKQSLFDEYYRLLYVALTRPRDELHLYAHGPVAQGSWYRLVEEAMQRLPVADEQGNRVLQDHGTPTRRAGKASQPLSDMPAWATQAPAQAGQRARVLSPSRLAELEVPVALRGQSAGANLRGVRIHRVLQFLQAGSSATHIEHLLRLTAPDWHGPERDKAATEIAALHQQEAWLWAYPSHAEVSIGGTVQGQLFSGQIDRLVLAPNEVIVVDYKTGSHVPAHADAAPESYRLQMKVYEALLAPLYPGKRIRSALLWTVKPQLMWMDDAIARTPWPIVTKN